MQIVSSTRKGLNSKGIGRLIASTLALGAIVFFASEKTYAEWLRFGRPQRRYDRCIQLYQDKQYAESRQCIKEFLSDYPNSRWVEHLHFLDAKMETDVSEAKKKLHYFVIEYPNGPYSDQANFDLGEIHELEGEYEEAHKFYSRVYFYSITPELRNEAGLRMGKCMLLSGHADSARHHLETYLAAHHASPWHMRAKELYADALYQVGEYLNAQRQYKEIISEASSPAGVSPHCYLRIAEIYELNENHRAAFQVYRQFLNVFPDAIQKTFVEEQILKLASLLNMDLSHTNRPHLIEAGVFASEPEAMKLVSRLGKLGYRAYLVTKSADREKLISVRLGPYNSRDAAMAAAERLKREADLEVTLIPQGSPF